MLFDTFAKVYANLFSARVDSMHMPDLRRFLPLIVLVDTNSIDPYSTVAVSLAYSLESIPQILGDPESRRAVDIDAAVQYGRTAAVREGVIRVCRIQLFNCQATMEWLSEHSSLEA